MEPPPAVTGWGGLAGGFCRDASRPGASPGASLSGMCRNIRVLYNFDPPTTPEEVQAASLQFVRKVSGLQKPSEADRAAFERAIKEVAAATDALLASLVARAPVRTREGEREKGRARWMSREARMSSR